ncbi:MAG: hypothetical protein RJB38_1067 [Pseudomonadota bacterium]|jgi:leucyl/phenylalanyl-tRNA--protein transferase
MTGSENSCSSKVRTFPSLSVLRRHPDPDGVVALEGDLSVSRLLEAYRSGIFPWPTLVTLRPGEPPVTILLWFCPPIRAILEFQNLSINRSLRKARQKALGPLAWSITENQAFAQVIRACASTPRPGSSGTWITPAMTQAYEALFAQGFAHSVEVWNQHHELIGGIYGVEVDGVFSAESMFYREPDASKIALLHLIERLHERGIDWIDIQMMTPHLEKLGARSLSRTAFLTLLERSQKKHHASG